MTEPQQQKKPQQPAPPPVVKTDAVKALEWHPMSNALKDGTYLYLNNGSETKEVFFYWTRQFRKGTWQACGWWRERYGPKVPDAFNPTGWRKVTEGLA
jgi:hypothetical protein